MSPNAQPMIWHVVFHPGPCLYGKYRHVSLAGYWDETWLDLDLHRRTLSVSVHSLYDDKQDYLSYLLHYHTVLRFGPRTLQASSFFRPMTCVSFVKHALGVRSGALRPDGLLRSLVRDFGAEMINEVGKGSGEPGTEAATASG